MDYEPKRKTKKQTKQNKLNYKGHYGSKHIHLSTKIHVSKKVVPLEH